MNCVYRIDSDAPELRQANSSGKIFKKSEKNEHSDLRDAFRILLVTKMPAEFNGVIREVLSLSCNL